MKIAGGKWVPGTGKRIETSRLGRSEVVHRSPINRIQISEDALQDLNEGFVFYEARQIGLGDYFVSSLRSDIERLRIAGGTHRIVFQDFH